ncbi:MAG TPA: adenylosuccinate lyase, partial [Coriobacteriia bacterium]|nr:adenylosuccinate lyase [Coriobacteriia bacterium]
LLALVDTGMQREDAYKVVQDAAMKTWADIQNAEPGPGFRDYLEGGTHDFPLDCGQMEEIFDPKSFLTRAEVLFERLEALEF